MKKNTLKAISFFTVILCIVMIVVPVFADFDDDVKALKDQLKAGTITMSEYVSQYNTLAETNNKPKILISDVGEFDGTRGDDVKGLNTARTVGQTVAQAVRNTGIIIAVIVIMIIGIKYLMGSAEQKAEYKKTMIPYLVGAVLIFAGAIIAGGIIDMASGLSA